MGCVCVYARTHGRVFPRRSVAPGRLYVVDRYNDSIRHAHTWSGIHTHTLQGKEVMPLQKLLFCPTSSLYTRRQLHPHSYPFASSFLSSLSYPWLLLLLLDGVGRLVWEYNPSQITYYLLQILSNQSDNRVCEEAIGLRDYIHLIQMQLFTMSITLWKICEVPLFYFTKVVLILQLFSSLSCIFSFSSTTDLIPAGNIFYHFSLIQQSLFPLLSISSVLPLTLSSSQTPLSPLVS